MAERSEIDEVRQRVDIVSTIEQYVALKRMGKVFKGLCPFHNEKTPSFQVSAERQTWHCFGSCAEGGDVIKFVQKVENLSFPEALEKLALRAGVTLTGPGGPGGQRNQYQEVSERDRIYKVNGLALNYYREMLSVSEVAQKYVADRKISQETQQEFSIGYAPESWDGLTNYLVKHRVPLADAVLAELVTRHEQRGSYFDKLRGRLIFPILDVQGRPIAFGGRILGPVQSGQPKYWNSPEHPAFHKSRTLYGLNAARKAIADMGSAIVVEGYTDVIAAHQAGFKNVVATLGTSLTEEHVKILGRLTKFERNVAWSTSDRPERLVMTLCFDADSAGLKAAFRAGEIFQANDIDVTVLDLPGGEDPDSLLRSGRREEFANAIENALPLVEYQLRRLIRISPTETDRDRIALIRKAMPILGSVKSIIEREPLVHIIAPYHPGFRNGSVSSEDHIRQDIATYQATHGGGREQQAETPRPQRATPVRAAGEGVDRHLIRALLSGDVLMSSRVMEAVKSDEFLTESGRALARLIYTELGRNPNADLAAVIGTIVDETLANSVTDIVMGDEEPLTDVSIDSVIVRLKKLHMEAERQRLRDLYVNGRATDEECAEYFRLNALLKGSG